MIQNRHKMNNDVDKEIIIACLSNDATKFTQSEKEISDLKLKQFPDNLSLFKAFLDENFDVLVMYYHETHKIIDENDIARYLVMNPLLIIIIIINPTFNNEKKIKFLKSGVDRFLINPVTNDLLMTNIYAAVRSNTSYKEEYFEAPLLINQSSWKLRANGWQLKSPNGKTVQLTGREFNLLNMLASKPGETVNKYILAEKLLGKYNQNGSRRITLLVGRLRKKVLETLDIELPITTVHSIGYACVAPIEIE